MGEVISEKGEEHILKENLSPGLEQMRLVCQSWLFGSVCKEVLHPSVERGAGQCVDKFAGYDSIESRAKNHTGVRLVLERVKK